MSNKDRVKELLRKHFIEREQATVRWLKEALVAIDDIPTEEQDEWLLKLETDFGREEMQYFHALSPTYQELLQTLPSPHPAEWDHYLECMRTRAEVIKEITPEMYALPVSKAKDYYKRWSEKLHYLAVQCTHTDEFRAYHDLAVSTLVCDAHSLGRKVRWTLPEEYDQVKRSLERRLLSFYCEIREIRDIDTPLDEAVAGDSRLAPLRQFSGPSLTTVDYTLIPILHLNEKNLIYFLRDKNNHYDPFTMIGLGDFQVSAFYNRAESKNYYQLWLANGIQEKKELPELVKLGF